MSTSRPGTALRCALAALACALLVLAGCERRDARPSPLQRILSSGELRVGTAADVPPLAMRDRDGQLIGLEIDLVQALAATMNVKVRFVEIPFSELIPALERGEIDLAVAGMTITPERNARVAFAGPYLISGNTLLARKRELADTEDPAQLDDPKLSFAALDSSTSASFVRTHMPKAKLVTFPDNDVGREGAARGRGRRHDRGSPGLHGRALAQPRRRALHALRAVHDRAAGNRRCPPASRSSSTW